MIIEQKMGELRELKESLTNIGHLDYSADRVKNSAVQEAPFVRTVSRIIELEKVINEEIDEYADEKHKMICQIQGLSDSRYIDVLYKKYVEDKEIHAIAREMCYSEQYVISLHGQALESFELQYKDDR